MPFAYMHVLNRSWIFSRGEPLAAISARIAKDLQCEPKQIDFYGKNSHSPLKSAEDDMRVILRMIVCHEHQSSIEAERE